MARQIKKTSYKKLQSIQILTYIGVYWGNTFIYNINFKIKKMELTLTQKNYIQDQYEGLKNDEQTLGEVHEIIVDFCVDNMIVDLSEDEEGDMFEEFSNNVWDYLETIA